MGAHVLEIAPFGDWTLKSVSGQIFPGAAENKDNLMAQWQPSQKHWGWWDRLRKTLDVSGSRPSHGLGQRFAKAEGQTQHKVDLSLLSPSLLILSLGTLSCLRDAVVCVCHFLPHTRVSQWRTLLMSTGSFGLSEWIKLVSGCGLSQQMFISCVLHLPGPYVSKMRLQRESPSGPSQWRVEIRIQG